MCCLHMTGSKCGLNNQIPIWGKVNTLYQQLISENTVALTTWLLTPLTYGRVMCVIDVQI